MNADFQFVPAPLASFSPLFSMTAEQLAEHGARRMIVEAAPGTPCRVSLEDAPAGEEVILLPYQHHDVESPFRALGPVFVRLSARESRPPVNVVPSLLHHRLLSLRAYDADGLLVDAEVVSGTDLAAAIRRVFVDPAIAYLHVHNAAMGCFLCQVNRV